MRYLVNMVYKCKGKSYLTYEVDAESEDEAIRLASSGKGYNGEDVDSLEMIGEPNITVEENE